MRKSIINSLDQIELKHKELGKQLLDPNINKDMNKFATLSKEYSDLNEVVQDYNQYKELQNHLEESKELLKDKEFAEMAKEDVQRLNQEIENLSNKIRVYLIPKDENDSSNIFLEIRAGTGGEESGLFSGDLFRMYTRYADIKRFEYEMYSKKESEKGGFKEIIIKINGNGVYGRLKFEAGTHRVQRVPETESQGRVHTSAVTVAILPVNDNIKGVDINKADLRIDTFRASGAGGQHVNKTDSAIRITHIPTNIVVECQDERSQHKNKAKAMALLNAKLTFMEQEKQEKEQSKKRKMMVGSGDRSEKIRTYNFPQGRVTDHRINLTLYKLNQVMEGELDELIDFLITEDNAAKLSELN